MRKSLHPSNFANRHDNLTSCVFILVQDMMLLLCSFISPTPGDRTFLSDVKVPLVFELLLALHAQAGKLSSYIVNRDGCVPIRVASHKWLRTSCCSLIKRLSSRVLESGSPNKLRATCVPGEALVSSGLSSASLCRGSWCWDCTRR